MTPQQQSYAKDIQRLLLDCKRRLNDAQIEDSSLKSAACQINSAA